MKLCSSRNGPFSIQGPRHPPPPTPPPSPWSRPPRPASRLCRWWAGAWLKFGKNGSLLCWASPLFCPSSPPAVPHRVCNNARSRALCRLVNTPMAPLSLVETSHFSLTSFVPPPPPS